MKRLFIATLAVFAAAALSAGTVNYTADNETIFQNPERGFITMIGGNLSESKPYGVKGQESTLESHMSKDKISIVLVHYYLSNYRTTATLPDKVLNGFDEDMQVLRQKGMKAIIRFSYANGTYDNNGVESGKDASLSIVQSHINQYKSHWQANADVIFVFQAGIVGAWGEWYYTDNFGNKQDKMNADRKAVVDALLEAVPSDRMIQLRTPLFKTSYMGDTKALTSEEAFTGSPRARLGQHNDAFLYDYDNMGTYTDTAKQKPWLAQETLYVPIGGETDIRDVNLAKKWATYDKTIAEMSRLHWTFIQSGYAEQTTNYWRENGTFDELNRRMGYRYQLVSGTYGEQAAAGGKLSVKIQIRNAGFAPLYNERPAYIVLKNGTKTYKMKLKSDPRRWLPNGVVTTIDEQLTVPSNVPAGTYQLYLYLPDAYTSIASDARYAVRFANNDIWDSSTGMNKLNASVTVTGGQTPPEPEDGVVLPATLNKENVEAYSSDMTWYNTDYFDFGPNDAENLDRWAEWKVVLRYPGEYIVSEKGYYPNGHNYSLQLLDDGNEVSSYTTEPTWASEEQTITQDAKWNLNDVAQGTYTLRVKNAATWGQPKLQSLTLEYDGELPVIEAVETTKNDALFNNQAYDLLGRSVDASYQGIVIRNGKKSLQIAR
ncbi:MAG: DUF4832 domain-containing protein [Paludibacteraceae bacterium]|nr:DUF4832 domain-containing protein [Paludibacteraceae bacterium]